MSRVTVLGGCGAVGAHSVKTLASLDDFSEIVVGDIDIKGTGQIVKEIGSDRISAIKFDAQNSNKRMGIILWCQTHMASSRTRKQ